MINSLRDLVGKLDGGGGIVDHLTLSFLLGSRGSGRGSGFKDFLRIKKEVVDVLSVANRSHRL